MKKLLYYILCFTTLSCGNGFLDVKPSSDTVVPTTLDDFQQLLDAGVLKYAPELLEILADDYYLEKTYWESLSSFNPIVANTHVWADDIYQTEENEIYGWNALYEQILYANVVLDGIEKFDVTSKNQVFYNHIKGSALFVRAMALHYLVQLYSPAYHPVNSVSDLGIPVPLSSDVNEKVKRESVEVCYSRIVNDLNTASSLLRDEVDFGRPSKAAAFALLARVYLMMGNYESALEAADNTLLLYNDLTDLNSSSMRNYRKSIYFNLLTPATIIRNNRNTTLINNQLYDYYVDSDLRKLAYFSTGANGIKFKKDFFGLTTYCFGGLDTDEQYLIKAECEARLNKTDKAMETLNYLLKHMFSNYMNKTVTSKEQALELILQERRKQLVFRGVRWSDLKRLNRDGANITLTRVLGDETYTLPPNSPKWQMPIPANEIKTSGILQNER